MSLKFYASKKCGCLVEMVNDGGVVPVCCGEELTELKANTTDAAQEKHVPLVKVDGERVEVRIGSALHPMLPEHYIQWVYLVTDQGAQRKYLGPGIEPGVSFALLRGEKALKAYAYCNLHGLWAVDI